MAITLAMLLPPSGDGRVRSAVVRATPCQDMALRAMTPPGWDAAACGSALPFRRGTRDED